MRASFPSFNFLHGWTFTLPSRCLETFLHVIHFPFYTYKEIFAPSTWLFSQFRCLMIFQKVTISTCFNGHIVLKDIFFPRTTFVNGIPEERNSRNTSSFTESWSGSTRIENGVIFELSGALSTILLIIDCFQLSSHQGRRWNFLSV